MLRLNHLSKLYICLLSACFVGVGLCGCGKDDEKEGDLSGTLADVNAGWSKMSVSFYRDILSLPNVESNYAVTVPISKGKFSLDLPTPEAKDLESVEEWMWEVLEDVTIDDRSAKIVQAHFVVRKDMLRKMAVLAYFTPFSNIYVVYVFVDKNVSITGTATYEESSVLEYDMKLHEGWNVLIQTAVTKGNKDYLTLTANGTIPSTVQWQTQ